jgi:hypothetical protein
MASQTIDHIVDSLTAGRIGVDDFMRAVEEHVHILHADSSAAQQSMDAMSPRPSADCTRLGRRNL